MPSAPRAFTERITGVGGGSIRLERLQPARRVLRQQQPQVAALELHHVVASGDGLHLVHPLQRDLRRHPEDGGDGGRGGGVGLVGAARQLEVDGPGGPVRVEDVVAAERPARRRAAGSRTRRRTSRRPGRCITPPQDGQDQASSFHICPAATQTTLGEEEAAHTTSGSSALATMTALEPASPSRQFSASMRVSAARSSWSRERLSSAMHLGSVSRATPARYFSSTSITP